jgi:hypothetical protein
MSLIKPCFNCFFLCSAICRNPNRAREQETKKRVPKLSEETTDVVNQVWDDTELTSAVYDIIAADDFESLRGLLVKMPEAAHV